MLTKTEALDLVSKQLQERSLGGEPCIVVDADTIEKPYGWVFFYNTKKFIETGLFKHRLAGNGPVIVNKHLGTVDFYGMSKPVQEIIDEYERNQIRP